MPGSSAAESSFSKSEAGLNSRRASGQSDNHRVNCAASSCCRRPSIARSTLFLPTMPVARQLSPASVVIVGGVETFSASPRSAAEDEATIDVVSIPLQRNAITGNLRALIGSLLNRCLIGLYPTAASSVLPPFRDCRCRPRVVLPHFTISAFGDDVDLDVAGGTQLPSLTFSRGTYRRIASLNGPAFGAGNQWFPCPCSVESNDSFPGFCSCWLMFDGRQLFRQRRNLVVVAGVELVEQVEHAG